MIDGMSTGEVGIGQFVCFALALIYAGISYTLHGSIADPWMAVVVVEAMAIVFGLLAVLFALIASVLTIELLVRLGRSIFPEPQP